jgi:6-phosphogluconolactonase
MTEASVVVHADPDVLAHTAAARLAIRLVDAQAARGSASVVLTGGGIAAKMYAALREAPVRDAVDWSHVHFWWGDERFLPSGHPDRNETQAHAALLDFIPVDPDLVDPMPPSDGPDGDDPEAAAERYASTLAAAARPGTARLPHFDVVLLGVGEDGHVASVFPEHPVGYETRPVSAVRGSPKPPPVRITLTLPAINTAEEVWLLAAGPGKADAVGLAIAGGGGPVQVPAAGVHGVERTFWLLDRAAAAQVGPKFRSLR